VTVGVSHHSVNLSQDGYSKSRREELREERTRSNRTRSNVTGGGTQVVARILSVGTYWGQREDNVKGVGVFVEFPHGSAPRCWS
jgi:hypothetical protein